MKAQFAFENKSQNITNTLNQTQSNKQDIQFKPSDHNQQHTTSTGRLRKKCQVEKNIQPQFVVPENQEISNEQSDNVQERRFVISTLEDETRKQQQKEEKKLAEKQARKGGKKSQSAKPKALTADEKKKLKQEAKKSKKQSKPTFSSLLNDDIGDVEFNSDDDQKIKLRQMQMATNEKTQIQEGNDSTQKLNITFNSNKQQVNLFDNVIPQKLKEMSIQSISKQQLEPIIDLPSKDQKQVKKVNIIVEQKPMEEQKPAKQEKNPKVISKFKKQERSKSVESKKSQKKLKQEPKINTSIKTDNASSLVDSKPFEGKTIVLTGEFKHDRNLIEALLQKFGARVTGSVSGKTSFLLQGYASPDGRPITATTSSRKALQLKTHIIPHDDLQAFFSQWTNKSLTQQLGIKQVPKPQVKTTQHLPTNNNQNTFTLWCQKYVPKSLDEVIGQQAPINKARKWLQSWQNVHVKGIKHNIQKSYQYFYPKGDLNSKAILFSGSPGIGKTTVARLLATEYGYNVVEYNASDTRNKSSVGIIQTTSAGLSFQLKKDKRLLILDEIDGLSGGDRGGSAAMIQIIKKSAIPIICICNDRQNTKIKSLGGHCYDVMFEDPSKQQVLKRLNTILQNQGIKFDKSSLVSMIQTFNGDMRQILNFLNFESMSHMNIRQNKNSDTSVQSFKKDQGVLMNLWTASNRLLNRVQFSKLSMRQRLDLFFVDSEFVPLIVQNCLRSSFQFPKMQPKMIDIRKKQICQTRQKFSVACDYIGIGDILNRSIRKNQLWKLSPLSGLFSSVFPTEIITNSAKAVFPQWLGNNSKSKKISRQIKQLQSSYRVVSSGGRKSAKDYTKVLFHLIHHNLQKHQKDGSKKANQDDESGLNKAIALMSTYRLTPDMIKQHCVDIQLKDADLMSNISTPTKTLLTKTYNERFNSSKTTFVKTKAARGQEISRYDPLMQQVIIEQQDNGEQEGEDKEQVVVQKAKGKAKATKKNNKNNSNRSSESEDN